MNFNNTLYTIAIVIILKLYKLNLHFNDLNINLILYI